MTIIEKVADEQLKYATFDYTSNEFDALPKGLLINGIGGFVETLDSAVFFSTGADFSINDLQGLTAWKAQYDGYYIVANVGSLTGSRCFILVSSISVIKQNSDNSAYLFYNGGSVLVESYDDVIDTLMDFSFP